MSDLISRKRIEFELCESNIPKKYRDFCRRVINSESLSPSVDAVEVVRCRECKHRYTPCCGLYYGSANSVSYFSEHGEDFYCSYGERKEVSE